MLKMCKLLNLNLGRSFYKLINVKTNYFQQKKNIVAGAMLFANKVMINESTMYIAVHKLTL